MTSLASGPATDPLGPAGAHLAAATARPAVQQPEWPDPQRAAAVRRALALMPPLVTAQEVQGLQSLLAGVARGEALVVHGGDCAETFDGNTREHLAGNLETLDAVADVLGGAATPVVRIARMAGQYAKPRSNPVDAAGLPVYRGDIVNSATGTRAARAADPQRMLRAYADAASVLDRMRTGPHEVFAGHEALLLDYESALVRRSGAGWFGGSGHFLWIGERTRHADGAHVALLGLVDNPVGIKLGPGATPAEVLSYLRQLDPCRIPGRVSLIVRMGAERVAERLPPILAAVAATGHPVVWLSDPLHANTETTGSGLKTRRLSRVLAEVRSYAAAHRAVGTHPGGLHLELTGDDVAECVGGAIAPGDLGERYLTACDPRLNRAQAVEVAAAAAHEFA
ncbi:3-deoxy-7-phosphoheptulonate synthase [Pseudonocardia oroxyli]|uniref:Phospho-2-dehydro-3-deoxyheptonate aldolase n=1 Tax=Pseudonocardia oroxyli TaxID=366584 RepID=A0A1G8C8R3_PSEOR|nr:3-deoxy-7-phosphoheptulonate synthase [Pseudonocardia oroxyli]SDH41775.1 3-deoxy-D-arabinoheptulosonate-7-phosphate synthase [Pseudonocardia oroxyli]